MDFLLLQLLILLAFMVIGSLVAVEVGDLLSSIICVGAVGFALAVVFLFLGAPDLAITQVVVEILALVILLRVVLTRRDRTHEEPKDTLGVAAAAVVLGALVVLSLGAMAGMQPFGEPHFGAEGQAVTGDQAAVEDTSPEQVAVEQFGPPAERKAAEQYMADGVEQTGSSNLVMAILLDFRAYDTLGEATVIFVSIVGAYAILRKVGRVKSDAQAGGQDG
jgi:multisubunit Na+/H+ antiporter MnhB subunit